MEVKRADAEDQLGGTLNYAALNEMSEVMLGVETKEEAIAGLQYLWQQQGNRFSHEHTLVAVENGHTAGGVTCLPVDTMNKAMFKTFVDILKYRKLGVILYGLKHFKEMLTLARMKEGEEGEYHISMLATLPDYRGLGVGSMLMEAAEQEAADKGYRYLSLTVKKDNEQALNVYESKGYKIIGDIEQNGIDLYRMRKIITLKPSN